MCSVLRYPNCRSLFSCVPRLWAFKREMMFYDLCFTVGDWYLPWIYAKCRCLWPISGLCPFLTSLYYFKRRSSIFMCRKGQWAMVMFKKSDFHEHHWFFGPTLLNSCEATLVFGSLPSSRKQPFNISRTQLDSSWCRSLRFLLACINVNCLICKYSKRRR